MWIDRRALIGIAAVSVLGNVFLIGLLVGGLSPLHRAPGTGRPFFGGTFVRPADVRELPTDQRKAFAAAFATHRPAIRDARKAIRERRREAEADIAAPSYDRGKVADDLARLRVANTVLLERLHAGLADALAVLPADSRTRLAQPRRAMATDKPEPASTPADTSGPKKE